MDRFKYALFGPHHLIVAFTAVLLGMAFLAGDVLGFLQPDYRKLIFALTLSYWAIVLSILVCGRR